MKISILNEDWSTIISVQNELQRNSSNEITRQTSHRHILMHIKTASDTLQQAGYRHRSNEHHVRLSFATPLRMRIGGGCASVNITSLHENHGNAIADEGMSSLTLYTCYQFLEFEMTSKRLLIGIFAGIAALSTLAIARDKIREGPEAGGRTYAQNYKDMTLAMCLETAYEKDVSASIDAGSSFNALRDWAYYDLEKAPDEMRGLVEKYLKRDYYNPLVQIETKADIKFSLLKCLDMYHSKELSRQVKRLVLKPNRTYRQEHPPKW